MTPRRVVTLPPSVAGIDALSFAVEVKTRGADLLEIRTDLHADMLDAAALASILPLVVSERGRAIPTQWLQVASLVDRDISIAASTTLCSHHAAVPLRPSEAVALYSHVPSTSHIKHVEPLGDFSDAARLFETQRLLLEKFGSGRVTVLAMGPAALPFRCVLACNNALDYVAAGSGWSAAPGQRLLTDAVREMKAIPGRARLGILGSKIEGSRSPRIHLQPFDRIDLPPDTQVGALVDALVPHYAGFAVTSPFKKPIASHVQSSLPAINTLVRRGQTWAAYNTDVDGAVAVLARMGGDDFLALGDGGVTVALRSACDQAGKRLTVVRRAEIGAKPIRGQAIWTWPAHILAPENLTFQNARVAVVAYGASARSISTEIRRRGGQPLLLGACWFIAQARKQRALWRDA